jgi:hypothetical protein
VHFALSKLFFWGFLCYQKSPGLQFDLPPCQGEAEEAVPRSVLGFWSKDGAAATGNPALAPTLEINYSPIP